MLNSVINQKPAQTVRRQVNWNTVLKISDFHNVISIVYHAMLGIPKEVSEDLEEEFYQKYRKELLLGTSYQGAEEVLMWQMEKHEIHALFLSGTNVRDIYPSPETAYIRQIEILVEKDKLPVIARLMEEMDYEEKENRLGKGRIFVRVPGIQIVFYHEIPIENKTLKKYFSDPVRRYLRLEKYKYVHVLSMEEEYFYRAGQLVEFYLMGILKVRDVLDFWQYERSLGEEFQWKTVKELLEKAKLGQFIEQIRILSALWFGDDVGKYDYSLALELEEYILSNGSENKKLSAAILPTEMMRLDFYRRDRDEEWAHRQREWLFPPREYMVRFYPALEKYPFLLGFFRMVRCLKLLRVLCINQCKRAKMQVYIWKTQIAAKMKKGENHEE